MLSDPAKLIPLVIAVGVFVCIALGKMSATEGIAALAGAQALHAGISAVNNQTKQ